LFRRSEEIGQACSGIRLISNNAANSLLEDALESSRLGFEDVVHHIAAEVLLGSFEDWSCCPVGDRRLEYGSSAYGLLQFKVDDFTSNRMREMFCRLFCTNMDLAEALHLDKGTLL
jgi:hypothetical protein